MKLVATRGRVPLVELVTRNPAPGRPLGNCKFEIGDFRSGRPPGGVLSPLLANLYLNRLDWPVNEHCELRPVLVRYADDFVIPSRPGPGSELKARWQRWLDRHGLKRNEEKTRRLEVRQDGFKFLGCGSVGGQASADAVIRTCLPCPAQAGAGQPPVRFDEGRSETVLGPWPLQPVRSAYSTKACHWSMKRTITGLSGIAQVCPS